jgi:chitin disaccharide deacetylase
VRRLIINADDFGLTYGVNQAIAEAHSRGVVTSTTLMANGHAFDHSVKVARDHPNLSVGCHVVLVDGGPVARPEQVRCLLAPIGREALPFAPQRSGSAREVAATAGTPRKFHDGFGQVAMLSLRGKLKPDQIRDEVVAQIERLQQAGITVTHVDAHKHTHMLPDIAEAIMTAASACGVRAIRNPFVPIRPIIFAQVLRRPKLWQRYSEVTMLRRYHHGFRDKLRRHGMVTPDGSFGVVVTGALDMDMFRVVMACVPDGTWEFVCHPGYNDEELSRVNTRLRDSRQKELAILTSPDARQVLADHKIELISYRDLVANH